MEEVLNQVVSFAVDYAPKVIGAIFTLVIGFWIVGRITRIFESALKKQKVEASLREFLGSLVNIGLKVLVLISVAGMFGIETTSFVAIFSALAFAIGLALQGNLANFASGVLILIFKFYKIGDFITASGHSGTVKEIKIFHTVLQALDNSLIIIPNGSITSNPIQNYTILGTRRHDLTVGIGYGDDVDKAKAVIEEVIKHTPNVDLDQGYDVFVKELGGSSINFAVRFMAKNEHFWGAYKYFFQAIKKAFDENGISIPFPQMDVHVDQPKG